MVANGRRDDKRQRRLFPRRNIYGILEFRSPKAFD